MHIEDMLFHTLKSVIGGENMGISEMSPNFIPPLAVEMSAAKVSNAVSTAMLAKTIDVTEQGGEALIDMMRKSMEHSVYPSLGGSVDISV